MGLVLGIKVLRFPATIWLDMVAFGRTGDTARLFTFSATGPVEAMAVRLAVLHGLPSDRIAQATVWSSALILAALALIRAV